MRADYKSNVTKIFFFSIIAFSCAYSSASYSAAPSGQEILKKLNKKESEHQQLALKAKSLNDEVKSLQKDLVSLSKDLQGRESDLMKSEKSLKELREKKQQYIESIYKEHQSMGGVVSAARKYSRNPMLSIIAQDDPLKVARSMTVIKSVIPSIDEKSNYLKEQLAQLEDIENSITKQMSSQKSQQKKMDSEVQKLTSLIDKRKAMYDKTKEQTKEYEKELVTLREQSKNIEELMENIKTKVKRRPDDLATLDTPLPTGGKSYLPVSGDIYIRFGETDDMGAESKGITFTTLSGATVTTPMPGIVKFAGPFQGHKSLLIIEHPDGYHSLISGLQRIDTVVGASLVAGEPVGITSQELSAPRVYYELRKSGKPVNPQKMLVAQVEQGKG